MNHTFTPLLAKPESVTVETDRVKFPSNLTTVIVPNPASAADFK